MVGSIPTGSTKNYGPQRQWVLCDIRGMKLLVSRRKIDTAKTKAHGSGSNPEWSTMPPYPIVGMDGTENPRKLVRLESLATKKS